VPVAWSHDSRWWIIEAETDYWWFMEKCFTVQGAPLVPMKVITIRDDQTVTVLVPGFEEFDDDGNSLGLTALFDGTNSEPMMPGQIPATVGRSAGVLFPG